MNEAHNGSWIAVYRTKRRETRKEWCPDGRIQEHTSLWLKLRSGLTFRSALRKPRKCKDHAGATCPKTHMKQWARTRKAAKEKWASSQTDDVGSTQSFLVCLERLRAHVPACRSAPGSSDWHLQAQYLGADRQGDRSKCHQPKARTHLSLTGATQTGEWPSDQCNHPGKCCEFHFEWPSHRTGSSVCAGADAAQTRGPCSTEIHV